MKYGLKDSVVEKIQQVFMKFPDLEKVILYGSRAMGNNRTGSDIDFTLIGDELTQSKLNKIDLALDDLLLPYTFDLSVFHHIKNPEFLDHIDRVGKVFYQKKTSE